MKNVLNQLSFFVGTLDLDGTLTWANQTAVAVGGLELSDVVGLPFWECYWWTKRESTQLHLKHLFEQVIETKQPIEPWDVYVLIAGGVELLIEFHLTPRFDDDDILIGALPHAVPVRVIPTTTLQDLKTKLLEAAQHDAREKTLLEKSVQVSPFPMVIVNSAGVEIVTNDAARRETGREIALERDVENWDGQYYFADMTPMANEQTPLARALLGGDVIDGEIMFCRFSTRPGVLLKIKVWAIPIDVDAHRYGAACCWRVIHD